MRRLRGPLVFCTTFCMLHFALPALANPPTEPASGAIELPNARSIDPVIDDMFPRWPAVRMYLLDERHVAESSMNELRDWAHTLRGEPELQRLREINDRINDLLAYSSDTKLWHETDYWELPAEALSRGAADCEGFAIFKMYLAKEAGISLDQMAILVGSLGYAREPHAILGAKVGPNIVTLDNKTGAVMTLAGRSDFTPLYSIGVRGAYTYPLNWGLGSDSVASRQADENAVRITTASRQAADDARHVISPAAAAIEPPAKAAIDPVPPVETASVATATAETATPDMPAPPPLKPEPPHAAFAVADAESAPALPAHSEPAKPKNKLFSGGGSLEQVLSFVFQ